MWLYPHLCLYLFQGNSKFIRKEVNHNGVRWISYNYFGLDILCELIPSLNYKASEVLRTSVCSVSIWFSQPRKVAGVRERERRKRKEKEMKMMEKEKINWGNHSWQVRWSGIAISLRIFHSLLWSTKSKALMYQFTFPKEMSEKETKRKSEFCIFVGEGGRSEEMN